MENGRVRCDNEQPIQLVTSTSVSRAAFQLSEKIASRKLNELMVESKVLEEKLLKDYLSFAVPSEEIRPRVYLTDRVEIFYKEEDGQTRFLDVQLSKGILQVREKVFVSLDMFLAFEALERRAEELRQRKIEMCDRIREEIMRMGEKSVIEKAFPEAMPYLEFKDFRSDIQYIRETIKSEMANENNV